jgi:hypothetical protein
MQETRGIEACRAPGADALGGVPVDGNRKQRLAPSCCDELLLVLRAEPAPELFENIENRIYEHLVRCMRVEPGPGWIGRRQQRCCFIGADHVCAVIGEHAPHGSAT